MARSTFYYHLKHLNDEDKYKSIKERISALYHHHKGRYGYRRITLELRKDIANINHKTVKKLMDELNLKCLVRKVKYHSYKGDIGDKAPNILKRNFRATRPCQKTATDVTQITIRGEKMYLSPVMDLFNGEILTYVIADAPNLKMVMDMLNKLYATIDVPAGMILHSDQGWHYQHRAYQVSLRKHNIIQSMSRKGNCLDNAMMENFFGLMKSELLYQKEYLSIDQFKLDLEKYIEYYNKERIKLRLNGMSPEQFRSAYYSSINN